MNANAQQGRKARSHFVLAGQLRGLEGEISQRNVACSGLGLSSDRRFCADVAEGEGGAGLQETTENEGAGEGPRLSVVEGLGCDDGGNR